MVFRTLRLKCALLIAVCTLVMGAASNAAADSLTLEWDPSGSETGYRVHVGTQPGSYSQHFDVGSTTLFTFPTAVAGQRYCFAVSAYLLSSQLEGPNSSEICGYSNAPPTLVNPGDRTSAVGQSVTLQLVGSDPASQPLTYSATGLPPGLSLMASTGFISGSGTTAGTYSVTVRAFDGVLTASQTFTWQITAAIDSTVPLATISAPTTGATWSTTTATMTMSGTASDNVGVTQVRWSSDRGGSGVASGTSNWNLSGIPLMSGANVITVTAVDAGGNTGTDALTVTYTASSGSDVTRPTVAITYPNNPPVYTSPAMSMAGTSADNVGVTQVRWSSDRGGSGVAVGTGTWFVDSLMLASGTNVITVTAIDAAGNQGSVTIAVTYGTSTTPPPPPPPTTPPANVTLTAEARKNSRWRATTLRWSNAPWSSVDVYRNGMLITNTENDGVHTDPIWNRGTYTYRVCAPGSTTTCSNTVTVRF